MFELVDSRFTFWVLLDRRTYHQVGKGLLIGVPTRLPTARGDYLG